MDLSLYILCPAVEERILWCSVAHVALLEPSLHCSLPCSFFSCLPPPLLLLALRYLVTWNGCVSSAPADEVIVWEVATGKQKRSFPVALNAEGVPPAWPIFKWSHDDRFFGRVGVDMISVYGTPSMGLLDKKSIKIPNVVTFEWSPTDPIIAYWTPEVGNSPARVSILELPSRVELRQKGLYSVAHVQLKWKEDGDFLACRVERYAKNKKIQYVNLELFRMRDKDFPIDILDFKEKELVDAFEWEPKGNRFAVIHGEPANKVVAFYSMESTTNGKLKHLFTVEKNVFNEIRWSPAGTIVALCRLGNPNEAVNGTFEWYNANEQKMVCPARPKQNRNVPRGKTPLFPTFTQACLHLQSGSHRSSYSQAQVCSDAYHISSSILSFFNLLSLPLERLAPRITTVRRASNGMLAGGMR